MLTTERKRLEGPLLLKPKKFFDDRGFFSETYQDAGWKNVGVFPTFIQDNHSYSKSRGTVRGMHMQHAPFEQDKLVRVLRGSIFDVVVDIRRGSKTFGQWESFELDIDTQLFVPAGFLHGFMTLQDECEVFYKVSKPYAKSSEGGVRWDDPFLNIAWPPFPPLLSDKDKNLPFWSQACQSF